MRILAFPAVVALCALPVLLAGCTQGDPNGSSSFEPSCPSWYEGLSTNVFRETFHQNSTEMGPRQDKLASGLTTDDGRPIDKVVLNFGARTGQDGRQEQQGVYAEDSRLTVTAHRDDDGTSLLFYDPAKGPRSAANLGTTSWVFQPDQLYKDFQLQLDLVDPSDAARPTSVTLEWTWERNLDGNPETNTGAMLLYTASYLYRTC